MPARSKAQQKAAGAALSARRSESDPKDLKGPSQQMYDSMSEEELDRMASTDRKPLPEHRRKPERRPPRRASGPKTTCVRVMRITVK